MDKIFTLVIAIGMIIFCGMVLWQIAAAIFKESVDAKYLREREEERKRNE